MGWFWIAEKFLGQVTQQIHFGFHLHWSCKEMLQADTEDGGIPSFPPCVNPNFSLPAGAAPSQSPGALSGGTCPGRAATFQAGAGGGWDLPDLKAELISRTGSELSGCCGTFSAQPWLSQNAQCCSRECGTSHSLGKGRWGETLPSLPVCEISWFSLSEWKTACGIRISSQLSVHSGELKGVNQCSEYITESLPASPCSDWCHQISPVFMAQEL